MADHDLYRNPPLLSEQFSYHGAWWLPEEPSFRVGGTISYEESTGLLLNVVGELNAMRPNAINGQCEGVDCSLLSCHWVGHSSTPKEVTSTRFTGTYFVVGRHFASVHSPPFGEVEVEFSGLDAWTGHDPFPSDSYEDQKDALLLRFPRRPRNTFGVPEQGFSILLEDGFFSSFRGSKFTCEYRTRFLIQPDRKEPVPWFSRIYFQMGCLLSILQDRAVLPRRVLARTEDSSPESCPIYYRLRSPANSRHCRSVDFPSIGGDFHEILRRWFSRPAKTDRLHRLFLTAAYSGSHDVESHFLSMCQVLEGIHRDMFAARGATLRDRLGELYDYLPNSLRSAINSNRDYFLREVVSLRNKLVHDAGVLCHVDMAEASMFADQLELLLRLTMLLNIGVAERALVLAISKY